MHHSAQSSAVDCYHSAQSSAVVLTIPTALPCYTTWKIMYFSQVQGKINDNKVTSQSTKSHLASHPRNAIKPHPIYNITSPHMLLECLFRPSDHSTVPRSDCPTNQPSDRPTIRSSDRRLTMANHGYPCFFMVIHGYLRLYMCLRVV